MLNPFPELLNWSYFAPFALRIVLALYFMTLGIRTFRRGHKKAGAGNYTALAAIEFILGSFLLVGLYTQISGAIAAAFGFVGLILRFKKSPEAPESSWFYFLASVVALSLIVLGAGPFAFDIPL
jgi:uncharacterized membrane protein YphA (DoxX/SURF4 family)